MARTSMSHWAQPDSAERRDPSHNSGRSPWVYRHGPELLLVLPLLILAVGFLLPITLLLSRSLFDPAFTLAHYRRLFVVPAYIEILLFSFETALVTTALALVLAYPYAYALMVVPSRWRALLTAIVLLPFWTNILVRCYSWMLILQTKGLLNTALIDWLGLPIRPLPLMFNFVGVIVGMVHYVLPPMVLILYSVMRAIDLNLVRAAEGLGAHPLRAFWRVFVPLSMPGVRAACVLIFILSLGFFVTPALLGGRQDVTIAMLIDTQFTEILNWGFGSALATVLLTVTLAGLLLYYRLGERATGATR
jgi:putative spermidine/putrescine transport system permease protein